MVLRMGLAARGTSLWLEGWNFQLNSIAHPPRREEGQEVYEITSGQ